MNTHLDLRALMRDAEMLDELCGLVRYNPEDGSFVRSKTTGSRWKKGQPAGTIDAHGYVVLNVSGKRVKAHRLAWFIVHGEMPALIDHINGDRSDNRIANLRPASRSLNSLNTWDARTSNKRTGLQGVSKISGRSKRWAARIGRNGERIHLGSFATPEEAHAAYVAAKREILREEANA